MDDISGRILLTYTKSFLEEVASIASQIDVNSVDKVAEAIAVVKVNGGRLFFAGSGGGAGHASHATCDFRKLGGIESYCISDNVSELTARINDQSWEDSYVEWLKASRFSSNDGVFIFSVGGGDAERKVSMQLVNVVDYAASLGATIVGVVGRDGGHLAKKATASVVVPVVNPSNVTTQVEGFQAVVWHLVIGHPSIGAAKPHWESIASR